MIKTATYEEVNNARKQVQKIKSLGITAAQSWCADQVHANLRSWQKWENNDRKIHPGIWELFNIKLEKLKEGK